MVVANLDELIKKISRTKTFDDLNQRVFNTIHIEVEQRIFDKGQDSDGRQIGTYSPGYKKERARKNYPSSSKVILQATNQMVNDFKFLVLKSGKEYGSGFSNMINFKKSEWVEDTYKKAIFKLTNKENKRIEEVMDKELEKLF